MKIHVDNTGVALVLVLVIIVISAGLLAAIMYYTLTGSEISGLQRKYQVSKEASLGAIDVFTRDIIPSLLQNQAIGLSGIAAGLAQGAGIVNSITADTSRNTCFLNKLTSSPLVSTGTWTGCVADDTNADPTVRPDITFKLLNASGSTRPFDVNLKIIDTVAGNSDMSGISLQGTGVVESGLGTISTRHFPYLYTIEVQGQLENSTTERAEFEILYAY